MIMHEAKQKKNLHMAWTDLRKAYNSVPYDWILYCLNKFGVHPKVVEFFRKQWLAGLLC